MTVPNGDVESPAFRGPVPRWKRVANNATVILALIAVGFGYSVFVVAPATLIILWLLRRDHPRDSRSTPRSRLGRALDSRFVQAIGFAVFVGVFLVQFGPLYTLASAVLGAASWLFAERFL